MLLAEALRPDVPPPSATLRPGAGGHRISRLLFTLVLLSAPPLAAQEARGWEAAALPALSFDSDEGFGYGAVAEFYDYGEEGAEPYVLTLQPALLFTTRGRRDVTLFFDAPRLLPGGWRLDAFLGREKQLATPYYGIGNATAHDEALEDEEGPNPYYYRFGREGWQARATLHRRLGGSPLRLLVGAGVSRVRVDPVPYDEGTTLLAEELGRTTPGPETWSNHLRAGLVWDSRDREVGPRRGVWSDVLVQRVAGRLGSSEPHTRWTVTDRRYVPVGSERLVFANRLLLQGVEGEAPFHDLFVIQTSFKQQEGLGGANTVRGLPKNRLVGKGLFLWNAELRWRAADFRLLGRPSHAVLTAFVDSGRVWAESVRVDELWEGLTHGTGGGVRLGFGESFVVAVDVGHSEESAASVYTGLGYVF